MRWGRERGGGGDEHFLIGVTNKFVKIGPVASICGCFIIAIAICHFCDSSNKINPEKNCKIWNSFNQNLSITFWFYKLYDRCIEQASRRDYTKGRGATPKWIITEKVRKHTSWGWQFQSTLNIWTKKLREEPGQDKTVASYD